MIDPYLIIIRRKFNFQPKLQPQKELGTFADKKEKKG